LNLIDLEKILMVPQSPASALPHAVSSRELVEEVLSWGNRRNSKSTATTIFQDVGLEQTIAPELQASELSGGMAQRLAVGLALASQGQIIILDEPSVGLDADSVKGIAHLIDELGRQKDIGLIVITHDTRIVDTADSSILLEKYGDNVGFRYNETK